MPIPLLLCDAESSVDLIYELKSITSYDIQNIKIGGIVEQNEQLSVDHAVTLEKQNIAMGRTPLKCC